MTTFFPVDKSPQAALRRSPSWLSTAAVWVVEAILAIRKAHRAERAMRDLAAMDDHALRDIGIARSDIAFVVQRCRAGDSWNERRRRSPDRTDEGQ